MCCMSKFSEMKVTGEICMHVEEFGLVMFTTTRFSLRCNESAEQPFWKMHKDNAGTDKLATVQVCFKSEGSSLTLYV